MLFKKPIITVEDFSKISDLPVIDEELIVDIAKGKKGPGNKWRRGPAIIDEIKSRHMKMVALYSQDQVESSPGIIGITVNSEFIIFEQGLPHYFLYDMIKDINNGFWVFPHKLIVGPRTPLKDIIMNHKMTVISD